MWLRQAREGHPDNMRLQLRAKGWTGIRKVKIEGETLQREQFIQRAYGGWSKESNSIIARAMRMGKNIVQAQIGTTSWRTF